VRGCAKNGHKEATEPQAAPRLLPNWVKRMCLLHDFVENFKKKKKTLRCIGKTGRALHGTNKKPLPMAAVFVSCMQLEER
jgi:hypothetical protein